MVENGAGTVFHLSHNAASGGWVDFRPVVRPVVGWKRWLVVGGLRGLWR